MQAAFMDMPNVLTKGKRDAVLAASIFQSGEFFKIFYKRGKGILD